MRRVTPPRCHQFVSSALEASARDRDQACLAQIWLDQVARQMSPAHALKNELLLHQLIAHSPAASTLEEKIVRRRRMAGGIADHALHVAAHLFRRDGSGNGKTQE